MSHSYVPFAPLDLWVQFEPSFPGPFIFYCISFIYVLFSFRPQFLIFISVEFIELIISDFFVFVPKMLTLKNICFLRVFSLSLPYEDLPGHLPEELRKMEKFNGNFFIDESSKGKKTVLTIQYQGDGDWSFQVCTKFEQCTSSCHFGKCLKKPELFSRIVLKENKSSTSVMANFKGLLAVGTSGHVERILRSSARDKIVRSMTIQVEEDTETSSDKLRINFEDEDLAGELMRYIQLVVDFSSEDGTVKVTQCLLCGASQLALDECEGRFAVFHLFCSMLAFL